MDNIFERLKQFSYIAEAKPPVSTDMLLLVEVNQASAPGFYNDMNKLNVAGVIANPDTAQANTHFVLVDANSKTADINNHISTMQTNGNAKLLTVDAAANELFNSYFPKNVITPSVEEIKTTCSESTKVLNTLDAQTNTFTQKKLDDIRNGFKTITYANKDVAIFQLATILSQMNDLKKSGGLSDRNEIAFNRDMIDAKQKLGLPDDAFSADIMQSIRGSEAYYLSVFMHTLQNTQEEVADEYGLLMHRLEDRRSYYKPDEFEKMKQLAYDSMTEKMARIKLINDYPELKVNSGEQDKNAGKDINVKPSGAEDENAFVYEFNFQLPLDRQVNISNLEKYKIVKGKNKKDIGAATSVLGKAEPALFSLLGYTPTGKAAGVIAAYDPVRQFAGDATQLAAASTLGLLGSILGKDAKEFGTGIGKFIKHEMIDGTTHINPALVSAEQWLVNTFDVTKAGSLIKNSQAKKSTNPEITAAVSKFEQGNKKVNEQAVAAPAPAAGGESSVTPGGDGMNEPGMINGAGDPVAPTRTTNGSGDNFNPKRKKKILKEEHVLSFDMFKATIYSDK